MGTALTGSIDRGHSATFRIGAYAPGDSSSSAPVALTVSAGPFGHAPTADQWTPAEAQQAGPDVEHIPADHGTSTILPDAVEAHVSGAQDIPPGGKTRDLKFSGLDDVLEGAELDDGGSMTLSGPTSPIGEAGGASRGTTMSYIEGWQRAPTTLDIAVLHETATDGAASLHALADTDAPAASTSRVSTATPLTDTIDGDYTAPSTINVHFLTDEGGSGAFDFVSFTDPSGNTFKADGWTSYEQQQGRLAFQQFSGVADVTFNFVTDISQADFVMVTGDESEVGAPGYWAVGGGTITVDSVDYTVDGVGVFNWESRGWDFSGIVGGLEVGGYGFTTLLHQIGNGLGLAHPHDDDGNSTIMSGVTSPVGDYGDFALNQGVYTTMSLNDGWHTAPHGVSPSDIYGWQGTPMALDLAILQETYGANATANAGDTFHVLPDSNAAGTYYRSIWDVGGTDVVFYGGSGNAILDLRPATLQYEFGGGGFLSYVSGIHGGLTIANGAIVENATGGAGNDVIVGNDVNNVLSGRQGDDRVYGGTGNDVLAGGLGNDRLFGQAGADAVYGGHGNDVLAGGGGNDRLLGDAGVDRLYGGFGNDILAGGDGDDRLFGGAGRDALYGQAGEDRLTGHAGADDLHGGAGKDILAGGGGDDRLFGGDDNDTLYGQAGNDALAGEAGTDALYGGAGNDRLFGGADIDYLFGGADDDELNGGAGNDRLRGEGGDDLLTGGTGRDLFIFQPGGDNDTVTDFQNNIDFLDFRLFGFGDKNTVLNLASQDGADVLFDLGGGDTVRLNTFDIALLGGEDILI